MQCRRMRGAVLGPIMATLAAAMRAASTADFYMTKYQSKAQEMLDPVTQPFIALCRRLSSAAYNFCQMISYHGN